MAPLPPAYSTISLLGSLTENITIDSIGVDGIGKTIVEVMEVDTLKNGVINYRKYRSERNIDRANNVQKVKDINNDIIAYRKQIKRLQQKKTDILKAYKIKQDELNK